MAAAQKIDWTPVRRRGSGGGRVSKPTVSISMSRGIDTIDGIQYTRRGLKLNKAALANGGFLAKGEDYTYVVIEQSAKTKQLRFVRGDKKAYDANKARRIRPGHTFVAYLPAAMHTKKERVRVPVKSNGNGVLIAQL